VTDLGSTSPFFHFLKGNGSWLTFWLNYRWIMPKADGEAYAKGWGGGDNIW
jgi:hypothetical protein